MRLDIFSLILISFSDLLWTKPKARSGQIRFALPVRNVTGEASAHAQHKFGAVKAKVAKADFVAYNKLTTGHREHTILLSREKEEVKERKQ